MLPFYGEPTPRKVGGGDGCQGNAEDGGASYSFGCSVSKPFCKWVGSTEPVDKFKLPKSYERPLHYPEYELEYRSQKVVVLQYVLPHNS